MRKEIPGQLALFEARQPAAAVPTAQASSGTGVAFVDVPPAPTSGPPWTAPAVSLPPRTRTVVEPAPPSRTRTLVEAVLRELPHARVSITDNRTVILSQSEKDGVRIVRVHQMFLDAPDDVRRSMARYLARGDKSSGSVVDAFVEEQAHLLAGAARPLPEGAHKGRVHDLAELFVALNRRYFDDRIAAEIGWGQRGPTRKKRRRSITFGSWDGRQKRIIVHPVLDQPHVPQLCVARVIHHEMLHAKHGESRTASGRRCVHGRAFREEEATFDGARDADAWFDTQLDALLRWRG